MVSCYSHIVPIVVIRYCTTKPRSLIKVLPVFPEVGVSAEQQSRHPETPAPLADLAFTVSAQEHPWQSWWKCHLGWCEPEDADTSHHGGVACEDPPEDARLCGKSEGCKGKGKFKGKAGKCGGKGKLWWQGYCPDEEH